MPRAVVIGGGIGGLTTAIALSRKNWDVSVHEATSELSPVGKGILIPNNAMQVLGRLGLAERVSEIGWHLGSFELQTASGTILSSLKLNEQGSRLGHGILSMHRAELIEVLANALPPKVLHLGSPFTHFTQESAQVRAHFKDGSEETADLLVGADGIHSRVRKQLFPQVTLRYSGQTCFRGISDIALPGDLACTCREVWGGRDRFGFSPVGPRRVYWFAPQISPPEQKDSLGVRMERLFDSYGKFPDPIPHILAATRAEDTIRTDLFDFKPIPRWYRDNVALVGDAAHAMTPNLGQGGAQAIEDAFVLAKQCGQAGSVAEALEAYERVRMAKAKWIVKASWTFGQVSHWQNPVARWTRDTVIRRMPSSMRYRQMDQLNKLNY